MIKPMFLSFLTMLIFAALTFSKSTAEFDLKTDYQQQFFLETLSSSTRNSNSILKLTPELRLKGKKDRIVLKAQLRSNLSSQVKEENFFLNLQEAYWRYRTGYFTAKTGWNTFNWGLMDGYSPLDMVNAKSFLNPLSPEKMGSPAIDLKFEKNFWGVQALYIPYQTTSQLPAIDSRWLPRKILLDTSTNGLAFVTPDDFQYEYNKDIHLNSSNRHNYGLRLTARMADWDFAFIHFEGQSVLPQFKISASGNLHPTLPNTVTINSMVGLTPIFYKQRVTGGQITWAPGSIVIKMEHAHTQTVSDDANIPSWSSQSALGLEKSFALGEIPGAFVAQYYFGQSDIDTDNLISSSTRIFDDSIMFGSRVAFNTLTSLTLGAVYDFSTESHFWNLSFNTKLFKNFSALIRYDNIQGNPNSLLGSFNQNDRVHMQVSYTF